MPPVLTTNNTGLDCFPSVQPNTRKDKAMGIISYLTGNSKPAGIFTGKVVAFTGTLQSGGRKMQRAEAQRIVKELGGDVVIGEYGRIRNANLLVLGTQAGTRVVSQKMNKAAEGNVPTITAEQFFQMIGKGGVA
jgi:BRCT domain type II-containing protein